MKMLFANNVHHDGLNVTVRSGPKWADRLQTDDVILLCGVEGESPHYEGTVVTTLVLPFSKIPDALLEHHHDPNCQAIEDLLLVMMDHYPGFYHGEYVSVVLYYVNEELT